MNARKRAALALAPFELLAMTAACFGWLADRIADRIDVGGQWGRDCHFGLTEDDE